VNSGAACAALSATVKRLENRTHRDDSRLTMKSQLIAIVAAVLVVGCGPSAPDISIHDAAKQGNIEAVKQHIAAGTDVNAKGEMGTPLHIAAYNGHKEIAELLITKGADVNEKDEKGGTPLHFAAMNGRKGKVIAELLIAKGVDVNAKVVSGALQGKTPLDIAKRHPELAAFLRKHGGKTGEELKTEASVGQITKDFYAKYNIEEEYQISFEKLVEIYKGEDDRSNISEGLKFFQIEDYSRTTATQTFFTPDDEAVPGPPPFIIRHKYVLGKYLVEEVDFPTPVGGVKKVKHVLVQLGNTDKFLMHGFDVKIIHLALITKTGKNKFSTQEVGIKDNGEVFSITGSGTIHKGLTSGEIEFIENGMIVIKNKYTLEYE